MNPNSADDAASVIIHETNHARGSDVASQALNNGTRDTYVETMLNQETDSVVKEIEFIQERHQTDPNLPPTEGQTEYEAAYDEARRAHLATNPDATAAEADAAGKAAGRQQIRDMFDDGTFKNSVDNTSYPDYYRNGYDKAWET